MTDDEKLIERLREAVEQAEAETAIAWADAEHTGERPDLADTEIEVLADDVRAILTRLTALIAEKKRLRGALRDADELAEAITFNREPRLAQHAEDVRWRIRAALSGDEGRA